MTAVYEILGPNRIQVVDLLLQKYQTKYDNLDKETIKLVIEEVIPENKKDFGSWRGWGIFCLDKKLVELIETKLVL